MTKRSGAPYRRVVISFWTDPDVKDVLSRDEKLFLTYLFTNEHSHPCGVYRLRRLIVEDELGVAEDEMRAFLEGPVSQFVTYDWRTEEVFVHAMAEHQIDGRGLHGQDRRIRWVTSQLQVIHAKHLVRAFRARYGDWNLPWNEIEGAETDPEPTRNAPERGMGHPMPLGKARNHAEKEGASQGAWEAKASPSPSPSTEGYLPSSHSSGDTLGLDVESTHRDGSAWTKPPVHPETERLWSGGLREAVRTLWHCGRETVEVPTQDGGTKRVGAGLERELLSDLIREGGPELAEWAVLNGRRVIELPPSEPCTLYALVGGSPDAAANLSVVRGAFEKAQAPVGTSGVRSMAPPGARSTSELQAEAKRKLEQARREAS